jgi:P-type conjugative transfer protein TrbJ
MKRCFILSILTLLLHAAPAHALTVTCSNCSNALMQALDRVTNMEQLSTLTSDYKESVTQTAQQIRMVQQNMERYQNMLQNTMRLPDTLLNELKGNLTRLAHLSNNLKTLRGDIAGLGQIFTNLFPEQGMFEELAGANPAQTAQANARYEQEWDKWARTVDQASQATFQLSGQQLQDLQSDPEGFQQYIDNLLSTPEGQQQALMAGNQLAAIQVQEARQLRELVATQTQSALASQMKAEKESQMQQEAWRNATKVDGLQNLNSKTDPF